MKFENEELEEFRIMPGDLLICEGGGQGAALSGMTNQRKFIFQKAIHRARPLKGILAEYLQICLATDSKLGRLDKYFTGASIRRYLTGDKLSRYLLASPSTNEQHRVVAKVDQLMALCNALKSQTEAFSNK
ncbi:restriction endonuclease subunit S domain-containing protein [Nitrosomonas communis]|nr:hypothetical protein [Nitrosomonas communis]